MIRSDDNFRKIYSVGFEFETSQMLSVLNIKDKFITQDYFYVIPKDIDDCHIKLTNDVIDEEIGKHKCSFGDVYTTKKEGYKYLTKIKMPMNAEHTELHLTYYDIKRSNDFINEYILKSKEILYSLFNNKSTKYLIEHFKDDVKITNLMSYIEFKDMECPKKCGVFIMNKINIENCKFVPQMTFSVELKDLLDVCNSLVIDTVCYSYWNYSVNNAKDLMKKLKIKSDRLLGFLSLAYFILDNSDENYKCKKTELCFIARHYFWEFYPYSEEYDSVLKSFVINDNSKISILIRNIFKFSQRKTLKYVNVFNRIVQNFNPLLEDIMEYDEIHEKDILNDISNLDFKVDMFEKEIYPCKYDTKSIFVDTKKYQLIKRKIENEEKELILIEFRGFLHYFKDNYISLDSL